MFYKIEDPPQWLLDGLFNEDKAKSGNPCPDCGVKVGEKHGDNCDVARCLGSGGQRLCCDCGDCGDDIWTGYWPGIKEAYEQKLVCFDTASSSIMFDLNAAQILFRYRLLHGQVKNVKLGQWQARHGLDVKCSKCGTIYNDRHKCPKCRQESPSPIELKIIARTKKIK